VGAPLFSFAPVLLSYKDSAESLAIETCARRHPSATIDRVVNSDRVFAYRQVVATLRELGPSKLLPDEQERIRHAADQLILTEELFDDPAALDALADAQRLCHDLVEAERWEQDRAMQLADDVAACGPSALTHLPLAA
jgi:hypothetical protein